MSFLKRAEVERHTQMFHANDKIQKHGIVKRTATPGKPQGSPYVKRVTEFNGYKRKELIQNNMTPIISHKTISGTYNPLSVPRSEAEYKLNELERLYRTRLARQWEKCSMASSCSSRSSKPSSRHHRFNNKPKKLVRESTTTRILNNRYRKNLSTISDDVSVRGIRNNGHSQFMLDTISNASSTIYGSNSSINYQSFHSSQESLSSIQTGQTENDLDTSPATTNGSLENNSISDESPNHTNASNRTETKLQLATQSAIDRSLLSLPIVLVEKYIPPYDVLFEKFLKKNV